MKSTNKLPPRERILTTAHQLFYQQGIRATGIDKIIAQSEVAKVTFYRHFSSKNDLIRAFLAYRHQGWITWFKQALARHGNDIYALPATLAEWFESKSFRGCAFLNTVGELAEELPEVLAITREHKRDMMNIVSEMIPPSTERDAELAALGVAIDGAIVCAQYEATAKSALKGLEQIISAFAATWEGAPCPRRTENKRED